MHKKLLNLWINKNDRQKYKNCTANAEGIRIKYSSKLDQTVVDNVRSLIKFLRKNYYFPIRCNICITYNRNYKSSEDGHHYYGIFYDNEGLYKNRNIYPQIAVAAATHKGRTIEDVMFTLLHELTHYFQWIHKEDKYRSDRSLEIEATKWSDYILSEYMEAQTIKTPFGKLNIYVDDQIMDYLPIITRFDHPVCQNRPLDECYRIIGGIKIGQVVRCVIEPNPSCKVYFDSGENYICQNFVKGNIQLTLGTVDYYDKNDPPYKASTVSNGLIIENVRENTKVKIGVAWVCDASENDLRTWFAADPTYITE